jgi:hypothetical protein
MSYRFARRNFLRGIGAAAGLRALLRNIEASAQGMTKAPRFLVMHRPVGTVRPYWVPTGSGTGYTVSQLLRPFHEPAGGRPSLRPDMAILFGMDMGVGGPGGGHEKGTVIMMTGAPTRYTRSGQAEQDDPCADAPSMDQVFLAKAPNALGGRQFKSLQMLCDDRIDFQEISTRCLSYDYTKQAVGVVGGSNYQEAKPMRPTMKPYDLYTRVFGSIMPGDPNIAAVNRARANKKSMLSFSKRELARLRTLCPASERVRIDAYEAAILEVENEIGGPISDPSGNTWASCGTGAAVPPNDLVGGVDNNANHNNYNGCTAADMFRGCTSNTSDQMKHEQVARAHFAVLKAALKCDLTRVATFQFSPGTNHVAFGGYWPSDATKIYMHHPISHNIPDTNVLNATSIPANPSEHVRFLVGIETWYNQLAADFISQLKAEQDIYGNNLLDHTVLPYVTEVSRATHEHGPMPVIIFGGKALGMVGGQYINHTGHHNNMWFTCARAFGITVEQLRSDADSAKAWSANPAVINGLWAAPA